MPSKERRIPGPAHPITVTPNPSHIVVRVAGRVVADTRSSLTLQEASYPPGHYVPRQDVDMSLLERSDHQTYCPYKGECSYYSMPLGGERAINAIWTYEHPYEAVAAIKEYLAFYPTRVDSIVETKD